MNIFGESFPNEVIAQIEQRQKIYGSGFTTPNRSLEDITYLNSKTSWCSLTSGVDITNSSLINNPTIKSLGLSGPTLAKKFVLFNGTSEYPNNIDDQRSGITDSTSIYGNKDGTSNAAYGIGGTDFGINPMMGITSANIKHENRGSLRRAEVKIKAWNKNQFEIIDALYLRLGMSVLLEWGHTVLVDNKGDYQTWGTSPYTSLSNLFLTNGGNNSWEDWLYTIYTKRLTTHGNYDGMLAKVANFKWSFNPDGSYDISVFLVSEGDVIESLKVNILTSSPGVKSDPGTGAGDSSGDKDTFNETLDSDISKDIIDAFAFSSTIGNFIYMCKEFIDGDVALFGGDELKISTWGGFSSDVIIKGTWLNASNPTQEAARNSLISDPVKGCINFNCKVFEEVDQHDILRCSFDDLGGSGFFTNLELDDVRYYIRLGAFLRFLEKYIVPTKYTKANKKSSILQFDWDINTNIFSVHPFQTHSDPRICFVNRDITIDFPPILGIPVSREHIYGMPKSIRKNPLINDIITSYVRSANSNAASEGVMYGNIMNIYLDTSFILKTIYEKQNDKGELVLIDFLKSLLGGVNGGLGGLNDFDVFYDETQNYIKIFDKNPLPYVNEVMAVINANFPTSFRFNHGKPYNTSTSTTVMQVYGYNGSQAGFISDLSLTTELSPQFSTMITVGAAAKGSVVGENETALSKLNYGFEDRYKLAITNSPSSVDSPTVYDNNDILKREEEYNKMFADYKYFLVKVSEGFYPTGYWTESRRPVEAESSDIENFRTALVDLLQKELEIKKAKDGKNANLSNQGTGFIPFNLGLNLDGLSGMKINQQFLLDTSYLPTNYPDTMTFLIKNLSHEISNNKWTTKIETYVVPKASNVNIPRVNVPQQTPPTQTQPQPQPPTQAPPTGPCPSDNAAPYVKSFAKYKVGNATGFCVSKQIIKGGPYKKTQVYIHHTASRPKYDGGLEVINNIWNSRVRNRKLAVGAQYVVAANGHVEQLFAENLRCLTQGSHITSNNLTNGIDPNQIGVGIEVASMGQCEKVGSVWKQKTINFNTDPFLKWGWKGSPNPIGIGNGISECVDWNGNIMPMKMRGGSYSYGNEFYPDQVIYLEKLIKDILNRNNISWRWQGKTTYYDMWPLDQAGMIASGANNSKPGIYTHGAVAFDKVDCIPLREVIAMLKRI